MTDAPDAGLKIGPISAGTPITLLSGMELAAELGSLFGTIVQNTRLATKFIGLPNTYRRIAAETDPAKREKMTEELESLMLTETKCPDFVVNRGHYFGTDKLDEAALERCRQGSADRLPENVLRMAAVLATRRRSALAAACVPNSMLLTAYPGQFISGLSARHK